MDNGEIRHWVVETSNPPDMINNGWSKYSLKAGDEVTVTMHQVKETSKPIGRVVKVALPNGKVLGTGGGGNIVGGAAKSEAYPQ
jgi:outer membrane usher protein FimD/PapC